MDTYSSLREIADSWVLLAMFIFFLGASIWAFLPSQSAAREEASLIPLRNDRDVKSCAGICETCVCAKIELSPKGPGNV